MFKLVFFVMALVVVYIAYTGIDVSSEYDAVTKVRNVALDEVVDPVTKKVLKQVSESDLDKTIESAVANYGGK